MAMIQEKKYPFKRVVAAIVTTALQSMLTAPVAVLATTTSHETKDEEKSDHHQFHPVREQTSHVRRRLDVFRTPQKTQRPSPSYTYKEYSQEGISINDIATVDPKNDEKVCGDLPGVTYVRMVWTGLEESDQHGMQTIRSLVEDQVHVTIDNFASHQVEIALNVTTDLDGLREIQQQLKLFKVPSLSSVKIPIPLEYIDQVAWRSLESSARVWVSTRVFKDGELLETPHSPILYMHRDISADIYYLYDSKILMDKFNGGDFRNIQPTSTTAQPRRFQFIKHSLNLSLVDEFGLGYDEEQVALPGLTRLSPRWLRRAHDIVANRQQELVHDTTTTRQEPRPPHRHDRRLPIDDYMPNIVKICFALPAQVDDQAFGHLGHQESWWAVGLRYGVRNLGSSDYIAEGFLPRGPPTCFWWDVGSPNINVDLWLESKVGGTGRTLHVATPFSSANAQDWADGGSPSIVMAVVYVALSQVLQNTGPSSLYIIEVDFDMIQSAAHAAAVNGLQRLEQLTKRDDEFDGLRVGIEILGGTGNWASTDGILGLTSYDNLRRKFVYEHEVGHLFHMLFRGQNNGFSSTHTTGYAPWNEATHAGDDNCPSANELVGQHGLWSMENSAEAFGEGFAQFLSTVILSNYLLEGANGNAQFKYYKEDDFYNYNFDEVIVTHSDANTADGFPTNYLHNVCGCIGSTNVPSPDPDDFECDLVGTELDWLRFYWAYLHSGPSLLDILLHAGIGKITSSHAFDQLLGYLAGGPYYDTFRCMGCDFGVGGCGEICDIGILGGG